MKLNEKRVVNDIRLLSLDMIDKAKSGHPGIALGAAPTLYTLFAHHIKMDLERKNWPNRDRFVLSAGHGSALLYATLFLLCNDYSLEDLKRFRQLNSITPGHPEYNLNGRIECTTGALGEGFATAVGMAMAEKHLEATYNRKKNILFDYYVYCMVSDGDLMEGITYEAASLAGTLGLDNLIVLYDCNNVTHDGNTDNVFEEDIIGRFTSMDWDVIHVKNGESIKEISNAIDKAKKNKKPTLIGIDTTLGIYSKYEGTNKVHSGVLSQEDLTNVRNTLGSMGAFTYDKDAMLGIRNYVSDRCSDYYKDWYLDYELYMANSTEREKDNINYIIERDNITLKLDNVIDPSKIFVDKTMRDINYQVMNVITTFIPNFIGGSADMVGTTKTYLKNKGDFSIDNYAGKNIFFGVREASMGAILNGFALTGFRTFASTMLAFSDYMKPEIRLSAMMGLPVTYIFTHDSLRIGEDGITHIPVEQLGTLRSIPRFSVYRPCDYKELIGSWNHILSEGKPCALVLPKGHTNTIEHTNIDRVKYGAYIISEVKNELLKNYIEIRVVSVVNLNLFLNQEEEYINQILPKRYKRMVLEFSNDSNWYRLINNKQDFIGVEDFGKSAREVDILEDNELDLSNIVIKIKNRL